MNYINGQNSLKAGTWWEVRLERKKKNQEPEIN